MPIEMPKGLPFSVDTWTPASKLKRHHFLTHAHKDHAQGITAHGSYPIYSTIFTKTLTLRYYPQLDESMFIRIEVGQSLIVQDPDGEFTVTALDANHCPGSVMFLFEGYFGNVMHTGDCRLTPECLQSLPDRFVGKSGKSPRCPLDCIFLDCTFGQFSSKMPSRHAAVQQVINCIWKHPGATTVYLTCDMLGQEEILVEVSQTFGSKIYVDRDKSSECFKALDLTVPESITQDPSSRFHLFDGFPKLYERAEAKIAEARANSQKEPLIIRPSAQWYACDEGISMTESQRKERFDRAVRDMYGVWHVCYSIHSSKDELEWALQLLSPKWVVSTTTSCRATELDYVKKHCSTNQRDDSFWRLLDMSSFTASAEPDITVHSSTSLEMETISISCVEKQSEPVVISSCQRKRLSLSPPSKRPMVTLFGRARLGLLDSYFPQEQMEERSCKSDLVERASTESEDLPLQKVSEVKHEGLTERREATVLEETHPNRQVPTERLGEGTSSFRQDTKTSDVSPAGLSTCYSDNLRRYYRSMHLPVPEPLPSLLELMKANKLRRRKII